MCYVPTKSGMLYHLCSQMFCQFSCLRLQSPPDPILGPPDPIFRVRSKARRLTPDQVSYWKGALNLLFYKLCLKMIYRGSRSTRGTGPSGSRLSIQKCDPPPLKYAHNFCFIKFSPYQTVEAAEARQTLFRVPLPLGWGMGSNPSYEHSPH